MTNTTKSHLLTIVYVEDNDGDALLLEEALRTSGHANQLLVIKDGSKALSYFELMQTAGDIPSPHCILLDWYLPDVTGAQLFRFIRSSKVYDDTPVYLFATEIECQDLLQANLVSEENFITKPNTWDEFLQLAHLLMRRATAKQNNTPAHITDSKPEVHAEGNLRKDEAKYLRAQSSA